MSWWTHNSRWYLSELRELENNRNYRMLSLATERTLVSSGNIIVRADKVYSFPILIVYPDATPYVPPAVYLLKEPLSQEETREFSKRPPLQIAAMIQNRIKIYYHRHQNVDGSLCILEADDLHSERAEIVGARATISRVRDWFFGVVTNRFPPDSREVELFYHFPYRANGIELLLSESFFDGNIVEGRFYFQRSRFLDARFYFGLGIYGKKLSGIEVPSFEALKPNTLLLQRVWDISELVRRTEEVISEIEKGVLIEGFWWDISVEPRPFANIEEFAGFLEQSGTEGQKRLLEAIRDKVAKGVQHIYLGLRFPGRREAFDWAMFRLVKPEGAPALLIPTEAELMNQLRKYRLEAVKTEKVTEEYFHLRNRGRADRKILKDKGIVLFGVGAIGSTLGTHMSKAGVGNVHLIDKGELRAHNVIRHECKLTSVGYDKATAVAVTMVEHNPYVDISVIDRDVTTLNEIEFYSVFPEKFVGVSSIADDNIEAWINELAVRSNREMFYVRALRGAKAARIFRVRPGKDACKECLAIYHAEGHADFIKVEEDPDLPLLTNECNNPVRPGSAADLGIVSSITARIVLDALQGKESEFNQWVWTTEELSGLNHDPNVPFTLHQRFLPPHVNCRLCKSNPIKRILITQEAYESVVYESRESGDFETGGVIVGFYTGDGRVVVMDASPPGPNAVRKKDWFERDVEFCQKFLDEAVEKMGKRGYYIGEWHFHPTGTNKPSPQDFASMMEIALQDNYETDTPICLILSPALELSFTVHFPNGLHERVDFEVITLEEAKQLLIKE
ncbi:ThiF family adenylyltransferase [Brevibacillus sp. SAFN-007a]|uniref:ThiF family adenylyltransferase n=1 Tax=Brevibacillus sp. SAFN-007a TaxID=3436862 RepID=UPI003F7F2851